MNLIISQSENTQETNVPSVVVEKLYNLAFTVSGGVVTQSLSAPTTLVGSMRVVGGTYQEYVTALTTAYPNLHIDASSYYIRILDNVVRSTLANKIGDGTGVTTADILSTTIQTLAGIDFTGATTFHEFELFTQIQNIPSGSNINLGSINKVTLPCSKVGSGSSITFQSNNIYELICPNLTEWGKVLADKLAGIFYIGGSTFSYTNTGSDYPMSRLEFVNGLDYVNRNKMLYLPYVTDILLPYDNHSCFGDQQWRPNTPYQIVYIKGVQGQKTNIANKIFLYCTITNLIINNTVLPDIKNAMLDATNVYVPSSILTSNTVNGVTTYSLNITDPWAAANKTPTFKPIDEFPTVATLAEWEDENMPVKLVEELMGQT